MTKPYDSENESCAGKLGNILMEGKSNIQVDSQEWVPCHVVVRDRGIVVEYVADVEETRHRVRKVLRISSPEHVDIVMLPDYARRSRESKLFPFSVCCEPQDSPQLELTNDDSLGGDRNRIVLAMSTGREMWRWASCIKYRGDQPTETKIPYIAEPTTINSHNEHYEDPRKLQDTLLEMFTYKNLPDSGVRFEDIAKEERLFTQSRRFQFIYYPHNFITPNEQRIHNVTDDDSINFSSDDDDSEGSHENIFETNGAGTILENEILAHENRTYEFGLFAYFVLVGSCVQVNEKCFELITSSNLYEVSSQVTWKGNSPISMLCEGDYNSSRFHMVEALWKNDYPQLSGFNAGYCCEKAFSTFTSKPSHLWGVGNTTGVAVNPEDKKLCRILLEKGDGAVANHELCEQLTEASKIGTTEFESNHCQKITAVRLPESVMNWGRNILTKLDLRYNGIFELPEELYDFKSLVHLDVSRNCLFGLSHKLGNLVNLKHLNITSNLIEELPYSIENLVQITDFHCSSNPISKPPSAVWSRGIANIRNFFKDMRESGYETNLDLRVLVLGLSEAGKTSLINGLVNPYDEALTRIGDRTIGIEKRTWVLNRGEHDEPVNLLTYDFAGQDEYYITHHLFLGSKALYVLAFDLSKYEPSSFDKQIMFWWDSIEGRVCDAKSHSSITPKVIIVGTHADEVLDAQGCADNVYDSLQKRVLYRKKCIKSRIQKLEKILQKIEPKSKLGKSEASGDSKTANKDDELPLDTKILKLNCKSEIQQLDHQLKCSIALPDKIHAVSSKDLRNFDELKHQIASSLTEVGPSGKYFPQLDVPLPQSWFLIRKFIRDEATKGRECMKLPQYFKLLRDELGVKEDIARRATQFCHDLGDVLYYEQGNIIFLRPSFLIDVFKYVIRHDHKESTYWTEKMMLDHGISEEKFNTGKRLFLEKGELEPWLLRVLWSPLENGPQELSITDSLTQLLVTFDIASFIPRGDGGRGRTLVIPEFQPLTLTTNKGDSDDDACPFEIRRRVRANRKLPPGLLKRAQVRILKKVFQRSRGMSFDLAQEEFRITKESSASLYCRKITADDDRHDNDDGEDSSLSDGGIDILIRANDRTRLRSWLWKVYPCLEDTVRDFPGLMFDHYAVIVDDDRRSGRPPTLIRLDELEAKRDAGEKKIFIEGTGKFINIGDLCPSRPARFTL